MNDILQLAGFILLFFGLPGIAGAWLAGTKGRSRFGWFLLCFFFPPTVMMILFSGPKREVPGYYRQCPSCYEFIRWRETVCKYCQAQIPAGGEQ